MTNTSRSTQEIGGITHAYLQADWYSAEEPRGIANGLERAAEVTAITTQPIDAARVSPEIDTGIDTPGFDNPELPAPR